MTSHEFAASALELLAPVVLSLLGILSAYAVAWARSHLRIVAQSTAVDAVREAAMTAASNAMQRTVSDLRDPTKPGAMDAVAAAAIKSSVVADVKLLSAQALERLATSNWTDEQRRVLVEQLVERAVFELKAHAKAPRAVTTSVAPPRIKKVLADGEIIRVPVEPPASDR